MTLTIPLIVMTIAYTLGAITKLYIAKIPNRYIPIQNVIIGIISALVCLYLKLERNLINAMIICIAATMSAGGIANLTNSKELEENE